MKNFVSAVRLIHEISVVAESQNHHPDLHLTNYRNLSVVLSTHSKGGLTNSDFTLAEKIDALPKELRA
jgi:4a-hydroxytetrahydrobiopterin dehydratase